MECSTSSTHRDSEITQQIHTIDAFAASVSKSFQSIKTTGQQTAKTQVQLEEVKDKLKEVEDELVKVLAEKTRKEAKRMALLDAIASAKARVGNLNSSIQEVRTRKQEYISFLSQQSLASEGRLNEGIEHTDETHEAISWYNRVLGFHVKGGRGVKFTFKNINLKNPNEEYSFTVFHDKNTYTLLRCEPSFDGIEELVHELNKTDGLFKFVRVMRKKFQEALVQGSLVLTTVNPGESAFISSSAPGTSVRSDSTTMENEHEVERSGSSAQLKKKQVRRRKSLARLSPDSASSVRQSPRLKNSAKLMYHM
ncbi:kinetochore protein SPC25 homolog isoform X2 [Medicago truncatula]|uniref:kinetochore protein SPC25 homolog isoform X2 n=1 Tax=Medicago truncatula TaxID=3880 RepID=UPI00196852F0|nr:kinetochore protein SPC25 homolog isoform X2 [Medicago truncatula]